MIAFSRRAHSTRVSISIPRRCVAVSLLIIACGARTALDAPSDANDATTTTDGAADVVDATPIGCTPGDIPLALATPEVMFVLDRSGSMRTVFSGGLTRWQVLTQSLATTLPPFDATMGIGALVFPLGSANDSCTPPSQANLTPALGQAQALVSLMQSTQPGGATPTASAIDVAAAVLDDVRAASTARAIVLATDGAPNCNAALDPKTCTCAGAGTMCKHDANQCLDDARTVQHIADAYAKGIPTYVIGIADSSDSTFATVLDHMAVAGGRPLANAATSYYPARSQSDMQTALAAIEHQVSACTYLTTSVPNGAGSIELTLGGAPIAFSPDGGDAGWTWANETNGEITLLASTCDALPTDGAAVTLVAHVTCGEE